MADLHTDVDTLAGLIDKLAPKDVEFATSLINSFKKYGTLTPKQAPYIGKLIASTKPTPVVPTINVGDFSNVIALFDKAKAHPKGPKYPKLYLKLPSGGNLLLTVAGPGSSHPGSINVSSGKYPNGYWYGRVDPDGSWAQNGKLHSKPELVAEILTMLQAFAKDPAGVATQQGKLTNNCCFCGKELTEKHSVAAGFGPICAEYRGLTEEWWSAVTKATGYTPDYANTTTWGTPLGTVTDSNSGTGEQIYNYNLETLTKEFTGEVTIEDEKAAKAIIEEVVESDWKKTFKKMNAVDTGVASSLDEVDLKPVSLPDVPKVSCFLCDVGLGEVPSHGFLICQQCAADLNSSVG